MYNLNLTVILREIDTFASQVPPNVALSQKASRIFIARKRSLGQGNIFTPVCHSVDGGGHAWLLGGMRGCRGAYMVARGVCVVVGGMHGCKGHAWLPGGMHGCRGMCILAGGCVVARGHAWLPGGHMHGCWGGMHGCQGGVHRIQRDTVNEQVVRILLECILV